MLKAKKLVGSIITSKLYRLLVNEVTSYDRYQSGELKVIGLPGFEHTDCIVKEKLSYAEWIASCKKYAVTKVEGIEKTATIKKQFRLPTKDIHLFVANKTSYSFKWHTDNINVFLFVVKGKKRIQIKNKTHILRPGQGVIIPKGSLHKAFSQKSTWALSVGFK